MTATTKRFVFGTLIGATMLLLMTLMIWAFAGGGFSIGEIILFICFAITLPWTAIGFWNAVIGFAIMRFSKDPATAVYPALGEIKGNEEITTSTAVAMCIRNEDVEQVERNLVAMMARLVSTGHGNNFHFYVLSDSSFDEVVAQEEFAFEKLKRDWAGKIAVTYRRRTDNWGFKAGNIKEFCDAYGANHDFMLTLDADSVMSASAITRLVRVMQKNDNLGILQSLVVGLPSESPFTRVFQFGMRMGMRSFTLGSAWWQADCGPYWGHNALIRLKPFMDHCHLPVIEGKGPLSGYILSHDQVEAVYMRRAGFECRVIAEEGGSYEENPPHILEFIRRDLRWCRGNMQYFKLLGEKDILPTSRIQLVLAILMFIGAPAWITFILIATGGLVFSENAFNGIAWGPGFALFVTIMSMIFMPKLVTIADVMLNAKLRRSFGGGFKVMLGAFVEIVFSMMLAPMMAIAETIFLASMALGKTGGWAAQSRQVATVPIALLAKQLWPQTLFGASGLVGLVAMKMVTPVGLIFCLPVFFGPALAIPFGYSSAHGKIGRFFARFGLWQLPEEEQPPIIIRALNLSAVAQRTERLSDKDSRLPLSTDELMTIESDVEDRIAA